MAKIDVKCRYCTETEQVIKAGYSISKQPRYYCGSCNKYFQIDYLNNASKPGVKEQIVKMAINGSVVRDTVRVLKVGINTVIWTLKNLELKTINYSLNSTEAIIIAEMDEQWSYVQNKQEQRWLWYALDKLSSKVVAYTFGSRADVTLKSLLEKLKGF